MCDKAKRRLLQDTDSGFVCSISSLNLCRGGNDMTLLRPHLGLFILRKENKAILSHDCNLFVLHNSVKKEMSKHCLYCAKNCNGSTASILAVSIQHASALFGQSEERHVSRGITVASQGSDRLIASLWPVAAMHHFKRWCQVTESNLLAPVTNGCNWTSLNGQKILSVQE